MKKKGGIHFRYWLFFRLQVERIRRNSKDVEPVDGATLISSVLENPN
jgi:hypothetical protein